MNIYDILSQLTYDFSKSNSIFKSSDLYDYFLLKSKLDLKKDYLNIYIKKMCDRNIIYHFYNGNFKMLGDLKKYEPVRSKLGDEILNDLRKKGIKGYYFQSSLFNDFSSLQNVDNKLVICVEGYAMDYLMNILNKKKYNAIFSSDILNIRDKVGEDFYRKINIVVKKINLDAPLIECSELYFPKIETLLIDILSDKYLKNIYGSEMNNIYRNIFKKFAINLNCLYRYARKKGVKDDLDYLINDIGYDIEKGEFVYDRSKGNFK